MNRTEANQHIREAKLHAARALEILNPPLSSSTLVPQETSAIIRAPTLFGISTQRAKHVPIKASVRRAEREKSRAEKAAVARFLELKSFSVPTDLETCFRHSGWRFRRARVINALVRIGAPEFRRKQFERCGSCCTIKRKIGTEEARIVGNYCHDRWCLPCQQARARLLAASVLELMDTDRPHRFITLTLPHDHTPLKHRLKKLYDSFKRMRDMPAWKKANEGGVAFLEVKIGDDGDWHPHLHIISVGLYFPGETLSRCWEAAVGTRARTHIKFIEPMSKRPEARIAVTKYLTTYAASPIDDNVIEQEEKLDEAMTALRGTRCCNAFGSWRGKTLIDKDPPDGEWEHVCTLDQLLTAAHAHQPWAMALLKNVAPHQVKHVIPDATAPP